MKTVSVSSLVAQINSFLKRSVHLEAYYISGECSNVRYVNGHIYFDLKDEGGQISCTMWKSYACRLPFRLEDGMALLVHGSVNVYEKRGTLQLNADAIELSGIGALYQALEERKKKLSALGYFNRDHKKPKPAWIEKVGIVTGASTAALQDVLKTIRLRWPMLEVHLFPASVQGENAPREIVRALKQADKAGMDAVLLVRGGGSFEDLFCFNDESIVKALYDMKTYTVSGIGHEIDTSLSDLTVDHFALTPTAAAQWVSLDQNQVRSMLESFDAAMISRMNALFETYSTRFMHTQSSPYLLHPKKFIQARRQMLSACQIQLDHLAQSRLSLDRRRAETDSQQLHFALSSLQSSTRNRLEKGQTALLALAPLGKVERESLAVLRWKEQLKASMEKKLEQARSRLNLQEQLLQALNVQNILDRGFSIVRCDSSIVRDPDSLKEDALLSIQSAAGAYAARYLGKEAIENE